MLSSNKLTITSMKIKKVKKQYSVDSELAIAVDVTAAKNQVTASSVVENAVRQYLKSELKSLSHTV